MTHRPLRIVLPAQPPTSNTKTTKTNMNIHHCPAMHPRRHCSSPCVAPISTNLHHRRHGPPPPSLPTEAVSYGATAENALSYARAKYAVSYGAAVDDALSYARSFSPAPNKLFPTEPPPPTAEPIPMPTRRLTPPGATPGWTPLPVRSMIFLVGWSSWSD